MNHHPDVVEYEEKKDDVHHAEVMAADGLDASEEQVVAQ